MEVPGAEQVGEEVTENRNDLRADVLSGLRLEDIEKHQEHVFIEVLLVFAPHRFLEVVDLLLGEEVNRRLQLRQVEDRLGRRAFAVSILVARILPEG